LYQGGKNPTDFINFRLELDHLTDKRGANQDIAVKKNLCNMMLGGEARKAFTQYEEELAEADEENELTDEDKYLSCLNKLAQEAFPDWQSAYRSQKRYMRALLVMNTNECPGKFIKKLSRNEQDLEIFSI
jgi:hypothetical protein